MNKADEHHSAQIAKKAYGLWENEGRPHGKSLDHWLQAEAELNADAAGSDSIARKVKARAAKPKTEPGQSAAKTIGRPKSGKTMPAKRGARPDRSDGLASN